VLINRDNSFRLKIPAMRNFCHILTLDEDKKLSDGKTSDFNFLKPDIHPNDIQTFGSYLTRNKIFLLLL
jgi:hypothetical protein